MSKRKIVSIIIPTYNNFDCFEECYSSLISQTYKNLEIIIVDDGSTTTPPHSLMEKINQDHRVFYYRKKNQGPSAARNYGIEKSTGDYLLFMDSDDQLDKEAVEKLVEVCCIDRQAPDVVIFGFYLYEKSQYIESKVVPAFTGSREDFLKDSFYDCYKKFLMNAPWNKLIRRELLIEQQIRFDEELRIVEDLLFSLKLVEKVQRVVVLDQAFYHYYFLRPDSLVSKFNENKEAALLNACQMIMHLTKSSSEHHPYYCKDTVMKVILQLMDIRKQSQYSLKKRGQLIKKCLSNPDLSAVAKIAQGETRREKEKILLLKLLIKVIGNPQPTSTI
ncbi:glycosyltransferase family 2 protein [Enterococcus sp. AZ109]|uniref:glycosyltransferase family 2 protein n=1 Tax=Enterococcus sp. AZ109 TaxID=2774634 RepID=UPI003F1F376A